jgi:hypothetical protein
VCALWVFVRQSLVSFYCSSYSTSRLLSVLRESECLCGRKYNRELIRCHRPNLQSARGPVCTRGPAIHYQLPHRQGDRRRAQTMGQATHPAAAAGVTATVNLSPASTDLGGCTSYPAASGRTAPPRYPTTSSPGATVRAFPPRREDLVSRRSSV